MVLVTDLKGRTQPVRLQLSEETLTLQKEELVYVHSAADDVDNSGVSRVSIRIITAFSKRVLDICGVSRPSIRTIPEFHENNFSFYWAKFTPLIRADFSPSGD